MSDYIYSSKTYENGSLTKALSSIYLKNPPSSAEFQGPWGTLAVTRAHYRGFRYHENDQHLVVVIGGPVLYFRDNDFLLEEDSSTATEAIYRRWIVDGNMQWDEDLSGPFTILLVDKQKKLLTVVTDLMAFIPVYICEKSGELYLGTHVDALAKVAGEQDSFDEASLADFVLNDVVTYPYTAYENIRQMAPSSEAVFSLGESAPKVCSYWVPKEDNTYKTVQDAAQALRQGISSYIDRVTSKMTKVAQFISAGEDSRSLSGMLPETLQRDAFVFLDNMNREGRIAKKVSQVYGANFNIGYRSAAHYLEIFHEATMLVGSGHQYVHAHSLGFDKKFNLTDYPAVFGGYLSDSLLKAPFARKLQHISRIPFLPDFYLQGETRTRLLVSSLIKDEVLDQVNHRRAEQFKTVKAERPITAHEWFVLRPATMRVAMPNLYTTRRLFRSYEPFMCNEAVKISAAVPTSWKLNRRLFNLAMKPYLLKSKWLFHADGRLPYFSWWFNAPIQAVVWTSQQLAQRTGLIKENQGPWGDWRRNSKSSIWLDMVKQCSFSRAPVTFLKEGISVEEALTSDQFPVMKRVNLMQVLNSQVSGQIALVEQASQEQGSCKKCSIAK